MHIGFIQCDVYTVIHIYVYDFSLSFSVQAFPLRIPLSDVARLSFFHHFLILIDPQL